MEEWLTIEEASKILGVSKVSIYRWSKSGELPIYKVVHKSRVKKSDVERILADIKPLHKKQKEDK